MSVGTASCLCGSIKVEMRGDPYTSNLCHCSSCQKYTGSVFGWFAVYKAEVRPLSKPRPSLRLLHAYNYRDRSARKRTTFNTLTLGNQQQVTFTESEPSVMITYKDASPESGETLARSFCGKCGSPVSSQTLSKPDMIVVPVGIVDGDKTAFKPQSEFYCKRRADWVPAIEGSKTFERMPPNPAPVTN
ncbi:Mss4-like protein [Nemania serpens]|nr:Mss4-like protein [Nemania serpens]